MSIDPVILFFGLGVLAGIAKSDLKIPPAIYELLSIMLLLTIGLKGGVELSRSPMGGLWLQAIAVLAMGFIFPLFIYPLARKVGRIGQSDAASLAAHYGSVSVATFAVGIAFLTDRNISYDSQLPIFLVLLEVPAIVVGILLARRASRRAQAWSKVMHEIVFGKSILLLVGGLFIGWIAGPEGIAPIEPLFFDLFKGVLALFLLEMGLIAVSQSHALKVHGPFLVVFGVLMPLPLGTIGVLVGWAIGLSAGGAALLGVLAGSASYIAAPAAMRIAVPDANPSLSLTASLGVTFPFNIFIGIPIYYAIAAAVVGGG
ncbi:MAG: sodium-dependent bicarbonate transport family permease [Woeseiaceae bacterium]|nr:sodium-dependent bicarbonate transport family permease [Woeseiaceae bacterium]